MRLEVGGWSSDTFDILCYEREVLLHRSLVPPHATVRRDFPGQGQGSQVAHKEPFPELLLALKTVKCISRVQVGMLLAKT